MKIYVDGSGKRPGAFCFVVPEKHIVRIFNQAINDPITNNQAEYKAFIEALNWIKTNTIDEEIEVYSDSKVVVNQLNHTFAIKDDTLRNLALEVWKLSERLNIKFIWVSRKENKAGKVLG